MEQKETVKFSELAHFIPRQLEAIAAADTHRYTLFGGSAGPGKSYWLRWYSIRTLIKWGKEKNLRGIHGALFSTDYTTLKDRQISKMDVEFPRWLGEIRESKTDGLGFHVNPRYGGHVLALRNLDDPSKYLSSEFALIAVEELTENEEEIFDRLRSRLRWTGIEDTKFIAATNPGGIGHGWVKKRWIDRAFPSEEQEAHEFAYVKALPTDNPHLAKSYLIVLQSLPEKLRKAYLDGNWDVFEGQYFAEWDREQHVVQPFAIPPTWPRFRSIDPSGREGITSCHWYALDTDGVVWCYKEHYATGLDADQHARAIKALSVDADGVEEEYRYTVMDTAAFSKGGYPETITEIYERHGVTGLVPADKQRIRGWNSVHTYLRWDTNTPPKLRFFSTCVNMIRTVPLLKHDDLHPEDVDSKGEDHAPDELRYFVQTLREQSAPRALSLIERRLKQLQEHEQLFDYQYRDAA